MPLTSPARTIIDLDVSVPGRFEPDAAGEPAAVFRGVWEIREALRKVYGMF